MTAALSSTRWRAIWRGMAIIGERIAGSRRLCRSLPGPRSPEAVALRSRLEKSPADIGIIAGRCRGGGLHLAWRSCWLQSCGAKRAGRKTTPAVITSSHGLRTISVLLPDENRQLLRICVMKPQKSSFDVLGQMGALRRYARSLTRDL